ncbi:MAG: OmpA family protein [Salinibacter sp.]
MTFRSVFSVVLFSVFAAVLVVPGGAEAQVWTKVKKKAKQTVEKKAEEKTEDAVEATLDGMENAVACAVTDKACIEDAEESGKTVVMTDADGEVIRDEEGTPVTDPTVATAQAEEAPGPQAPGEGVWSNYDFVPGDRVLFADDFSTEYVGDFPRRLTYVRGNMEVVEWNGRRLMRGTGNDQFVIPVPDGLTERYTVEFDLHDPATESGTTIIPVTHGDPATYDRRKHDGHYINVGNWRGSGIWTEGRPVSTNDVGELDETVVPIRMSVDKGYVKIYAREQRVANVPQVQFPEGTTGLLFAMASRVDRPIYLGNLRVATGGRTRIYEQLSAKGRVVTRGILFNTGSATLSPESTPTLADIGRTLQQHADLRLRIEGHTDNTGTPDGNQRLSEQRAEAVRAFLMAAYDVPADRLVAEGKGQSVPAASNETEEGRQTNRRVELVRM